MNIGRLTANVYVTHVRILMMSLMDCRAFHKRRVVMDRSSLLRSFTPSTAEIRTLIYLTEWSRHGSCSSLSGQSAALPNGVSSAAVKLHHSVQPSYRDKKNLIAPQPHLCWSGRRDPWRRPQHAPSGPRQQTTEDVHWTPRLVFRSCQV